MFPYYFTPAVGILQPASVIGISSITENPFPHGPVSTQATFAIRALHSNVWQY